VSQRNFTDNGESAHFMNCHGLIIILAVLIVIVLLFGVIVLCIPLVRGNGAKRPPHRTVTLETTSECNLSKAKNRTDKKKGSAKDLAKDFFKTPQNNNNKAREKLIVDFFCERKMNK
jgi:hypothetical protein